MILTYAKLLESDFWLNSMGYDPVSWEKSEKEYRRKELLVITLCLCCGHVNWLRPAVAESDHHWIEL